MITAEAVMMALAPALGREEAHHLVAAACSKALETGGHLLEVLSAEPRVTAHLSPGAARAPARSRELYRPCRRVRRSRRRPEPQLKGTPCPTPKANGIRDPLRAERAGRRAGRDAQQLARHPARDVGPADAGADQALPRAALRQPRPRPQRRAARPLQHRAAGRGCASPCSMRSASRACISAGSRRAAWSASGSAPITATAC